MAEQTQILLVSIGWIGIAIFGLEGLADREYVMPALILKLFPPAITALLITGAIAAIISTADSLLILSASELSENIIKPLSKSTNYSARKSLTTSRVTTALLAVIALGLAYISPTDLIFTIVSWVWAGIGGTFSVVILLTLYWKRYHGKAAIVTIITGMVFTIIWSVTGMDAVITSRLLTFFVAGFAAILSTYLLPKKAAPEKI